jgi:hypothetical protein
MSMLARESLLVSQKVLVLDSCLSFVPPHFSALIYVSGQHFDLLSIYKYDYLHIKYSITQQQST